MDALASERDGLTWGELKKRAGLANSSLYRWLAKLKEYRIIEQDKRAPSASGQA